MRIGRSGILWSFWLAFFLVLPGNAPAQVSRLVPEKVLAYPDLIVVNGKIATMDEKMTMTQAMAVRDKRILAVGTNAEIEKLKSPKTQVVDAKGRTVLPGLVDAHTHAHLWLMSHFGTDEKYIVDEQLRLTLVSGPTAAEVHKGIEPAIQKRAKELGPGKWIFIKLPEVESTVSGLQGDPNSPGFQALRLVRQEDLDRVAPDNPVIVFLNVGSNRVSGKGKEIMKAVIGKVPSEGLRTSYLAVYDVILRGKLDAIKTLLRQEMEEIASYGATTIGTHIEPVEVLRALNEMDRRGEMPIRWGWVHRMGYSQAKDPSEFYRLLGDFTGQGSEYLWNIGVGEEGWNGREGVGGACTKAVPRDPRVREEEAARGDPCRGQIPGTPAYNDQLAAVKAGLRLANVHATNDGTLDILFQMMEQAVREGPVTLEQIREKRFYFDHAVTVRPDQIPLLVKYGFTLDPQARQVSEGVGIRDKYGVEFLKWLEPWKSILDGGGRLVITTDGHAGGHFPPELRMSANWCCSTWENIQRFITREAPYAQDEVFTPEQRLDRVTALRAITINSAWAVLREKDLGSLEGGKMADFILLNKDYFTIPEKQIGTIRPLLTAIGGKIVYQSPDF